MLQPMSAPEDSPNSEDAPATARGPAGWAYRFGNETVSEPAEKTRRVRGVFQRVAPRYDLMNDLMSGGAHRVWKQRLIAAMRPSPRQTLLDVAGGTGDIATAYRQAGGGPVTVVDASRAMLLVGQRRAARRQLAGAIAWSVGDGAALPVASGAMDSYAIAFGLRNVTHLESALAEAYRVLRPGGRFFCLEFSQVAAPWLDRLYERYNATVLPALGRVFAGDSSAYRYLAESIRAFPAQPRLAEMLADAGFRQVEWRNLSGGIVAIHSALRP